MIEENSCIQEWLISAQFHWEKGTIVIQFAEEDEDSPGWAHGITAEKVQKDHSILLKSFYSGFGGPQCPRFIAEDDEKFIFPTQYDGATGWEVLYKDINKYLDVKTLTPYPGG